MQSSNFCLDRKPITEPSAYQIVSITNKILSEVFIKLSIGLLTLPLQKFPAFIVSIISGYFSFSISQV